MSRRNFVLLILALIIIVGLVLSYLSFKKSGTPSITDSGGTNFLSLFNPFRSATPTPSNESQPTDQNGDGVISPEERANTKLKKISNMPIAGYVSFLKERLKEVPVPTPPAEGETETSAKKTVNKNPVSPPTEL